MLDFSKKRELSLHAEVVADINGVTSKLGVSAIIVGAFARDLHFHYGAGLPIQRTTADVDIAFAIPSWDVFKKIRDQLLGSTAFRSVGEVQHRLRHRSEIAIDLVPFGDVETADRTLEWPPDRAIIMNVFGFQEALGTTVEVLLPSNVQTRIVSPASLVLLKIVAWNERHLIAPKKDAADLMLVLRHFLKVGNNEEHFWERFSHWSQEAAFDIEDSGARMAGHEVRQLLDKEAADRVIELLRSQVSSSGGQLAQEMDTHFTDRAQQLLRRLLQGIEEA